MKVEEAIRFLRDDILTISIINRNTAEFNHKIEEMVDLLKALEAENKKLDLEKRGLLLVNMTLKEENKAYKELFETLKKGMVAEDEDYWLRILYGLEKRYLGGKE